MRHRAAWEIRGFPGLLDDCPPTDHSPDKTHRERFSGPEFDDKILKIFYMTGVT